MLVVVRRGLALPKSMRHQLTGSKRGGELATCCCLLGNDGDLLLSAGERRCRDAACWCGRRCTRDACRLELDRWMDRGRPHADWISSSLGGC
uniref:Uncharacterized protein n=1 Tax=Zea mays TaxID=4577 RepID=C4J6Z5_MAIZE|nr:unknown [Zea mays]